MRDVRRKRSSVVCQQLLFTHSSNMLNELLSVQVISSRQIRTIVMVKDNNIKLKVESMKPLPCFLWQDCRIGAIEDGFSIRFNSIEQATC